MNVGSKGRRGYRSPTGQPIDHLLGDLGRSKATHTYRCRQTQPLHRAVEAVESPPLEELLMDFTMYALPDDFDSQLLAG